METIKGLRSQSPEETIKQRKANSRPSDILMFPAGLGAHCTLMRFFEYSYGGTKGSTQKSVKDIVLPLPRQLQDSFKVNIMGDELGIIGDAAAQLSNTDPTKINAFAEKLGKEAVNAVTGLGEKIKREDYAGALGIGADVGQFLVRAGLGSIAPDIANGISAGRGTAINPFATLVFKGVDLKAHTLEWLLSPESEEESRTLKNIIRHIQKMVLPKVDSALGKESSINAINRGILRYPAMVDVYFQGIDMNYYFKFKTSMISQFSVDYTPNGLAINKGGRPSAMRISMTLQEAYIHTADDYNTDELSTEAAAEKSNESDIARTLGLINVPEATPSDSVDRNATGASKPVLGAAVPVGESLGVGETVVKTPDGKSSAQPTTNAGLADEYTVLNVATGTYNTFNINQLLAQGISKATILANSSTYIPPE